MQIRWVDHWTTEDLRHIWPPMVVHTNRQHYIYDHEGD